MAIFSVYIMNFYTIFFLILLMYLFANLITNLAEASFYICYHL
jgi:hypothetical protein